MAPLSILFVCLGNICRSPLAEGILRHLVSEEGHGQDFVIDSAGTGGWHVGHAPDERAIAVAADHGIDISRLKARKVSSADFDRFDLILALDRSNLRDLTDVAPPIRRASIELFSIRAFGTLEDIPDPYYGDTAEFETVYRLLYRGCASIAATPNAGPASNKGKTSSVT
ncbi:low molecular weight protein-tyrosine-phosphatase [Mycoplana ramosa]|uniref:protein-tyrosine-phosphatase n=1 Tax=Mycoplana ramosa TaxID=40837 RepID=A0ABW3YV84_MYCRA